MSQTSLHPTFSKYSVQWDVKLFQNQRSVQCHLHIECYCCLLHRLGCRARLVLRGDDRIRVQFQSRCGTFISVCDQPPRSTQPGHPFVGRRNEYRPKGGDALRLGSKGRYGSCVVAGKSV